MSLTVAALEIITAGAGAPGGNLGALSALALLWCAGYLAACAFWPFKPCPRCDGTARRRSPSGRAWRRCPACLGTGRRVRRGRRAWDALRHRNDG